MKIDFSQEMLFARQKIISAARQVLASKKVSGTRTREIAQRAGISLGTLHYYFPSKTGLFLAVLDEMQRFFETRQEQLMATDRSAPDKIRLFSDQQRQLLQEHPQIEEIDLDFWGHALVDAGIRAKIQSMYAAWRRDIRLVVEQGVKSGEFDAHTAAMAPYLFVALLEGMALQYLLDQSQVDLETAFKAVDQVMMHWLGGAYSGKAHQRQAGTSSSRKPYPSDLNDSQWSQIEPLLSPARAGGRPRTSNLRQIVDALLYLVACGCSWRMLPHDFPSWQTVYAYHRQWEQEGVLEKITSVLGVNLTISGKEQ
jgi:putative transposase